MKLKIIFLSIFLVILVGCSGNEISLDSFAQCLTEKGAVMYGTEWCPHCQSQKALFGDSFQHIDYVNCELDKEACTKAGIKGFPTWEIKGKLYPGEQPLFKLSGLTKCKAP